MNVMSIKDYPAEVAQALATFQARREAVTRDRDLTEEGRQKRLAQVKTEENIYRQTAYDKLKAAWSGIRKEFETLQTRYAAAEDEAARKWDYARLAYERDQVRVVLKMAQGDGLGDGWEAARAAYEKGVSSGDLHRQRAYLESGAEVLASRFNAHHGGEVKTLEKAAHTRLDALTTTEDMTALQKTGSDLVIRAVEAARVTDQAGTFYVKGPRAFGPTSEFDQLMNGVNITKRLNVETMNIDASLSFDSAPEGVTQ